MKVLILIDRLRSSSSASSAPQVPFNEESLQFTVQYFCPLTLLTSSEKKQQQFNIVKKQKPKFVYFKDSTQLGKRQGDQHSCESSATDGAAIAMMFRQDGDMSFAVRSVNNKVLYM